MTGTTAHDVEAIMTGIRNMTHAEKHVALEMLILIAQVGVRVDGAMEANVENPIFKPLVAYLNNPPADYAEFVARVFEELNEVIQCANNPN